jgi:hypothetical protein
MSTPASLAKTAIVAACVMGVSALVYARDREQRASLMRVENHLAQVSDALDQTREALASRGPASPAVVLNAAPAADPSLADAVAARVMTAQNERAKAEKAIAAADEQPSDGVLVARQQVSRTIDDAIARGVLRGDDVLAMRQALASDPAGRAEAARQIAVALNTNKLRPADNRLVFP